MVTGHEFCFMLFEGEGTRVLCKRCLVCRAQVRNIIEKEARKKLQTTSGAHENEDTRRKRRSKIWRRGTRKRSTEEKNTTEEGALATNTGERGWETENRRMELGAGMGCHEQGQCKVNTEKKKG